MDPSGFDNPHEALVGAREAARILGVKVATLYSYASRRWVRSFPSGLHREKRYSRDDLERLRHRADARLGHEAVAAGALRWGEPVLSSALTEIRPDGPRYRGYPAVQLDRPPSCPGHVLAACARPSPPGGAASRASRRHASRRTGGAS